MGQTFQDLSKSFFRRYGIRGFDIYNPLAIVPQRVRGYFIEKDGTVTNASAYDASKKYPAGGFTATLTEPPRPLLLDHSAEHMAALVGCSGHCKTGDGGRMASGGLSPPLALAIEDAPRPTEGESGDADGATSFRYGQSGGRVWATYEGGRVRFGSLVAVGDREGRLDMRYQHVVPDGTLRTGTCSASTEILTDGRVRLHEKWQWTNGDRSSGRSIVEEVRPVTTA
jgi:hypothetical protein